MAELKRCPFCGGEAGIIKYMDGTYCVECKNDNCNMIAMTVLADTEARAVEIWNTRPNPWHTGTPTEGGLYFVYDKYCGYAKRILKADISKEQLELAFHDVVAWQKITPYEGEATNER